MESISASERTPWPPSPLPLDFFTRSALEVAPDLLGKIVQHGSVILRLTEVEAYLGETDPASHAYRGKTKRNAAMFEQGGIAYVYFTYGMHHCLNVVTGPEGEGQAVLFRAAVVVSGHQTVARRRPKARAPRQWCNGPAKLVQALGIGPEHGFACLRTSPLQILEDGFRFEPSDIRQTKRVGITKGKTLKYRWIAQDELPLG